MLSPNPSAFQILEDAEQYLGREVTVDWNISGILMSAETTNPYGRSQVRLVLQDPFSGKTVDVDLDFNRGVQVRI